MFPRKFGRYIEIFGGSGAVLLGKEPGKFEVYNDIEGELVNFFRIVKNRPAELLLELDLLPLNSREEFSSWLHFHDGSNEPTIHLPDQLEIIDRTTPSSLTEEAEKLKTSLRKRSDYRDVRQAAAYLMRVRNSYSSSGRSFACQPFSVRTLFTQILEMSRRLENVIIEQQSFEVLIPHYDREDSFFYGDPPYYDSEYVYDAEFGWDHHVSYDPPPLRWIFKRFIFSPFDRAQSDLLPTAPSIFSTPLLWVRYRILAGSEERCRWFFYNSLPKQKIIEKSRKISILYKAFTAFAYSIRAPPSEV